MKKRQYEFEHLHYDNLKENITIPQFQRSLVWSESQKEAFIQTIKEGKPFGSILVYKTMEKYEIIDGLQRFTTLRDYENNPAKYLDIKTDSYAEITEIIKLIQPCVPNLSFEKIEKNVIDGIRNELNKYSLEDKLLFRKIQKAVVGGYGDAIPREQEYQIEDLIIKLIDIWSKDIDFRELRIPTIIYTGDRANLPDIFERLNTGGTKLSRYEVFASTWNSVQLHINNNDYLEYIEELYKKKCERTNLAISNYEEGIVKQKKVLSLYELCFAFGKKIKDACKILFAAYSDTQEDQVDSIGFTSLATILGIPLKKLAILDQYITKNTNINNLMALLDKIVDAYVKIQDYLKNYISTVDGKNFTKFIEAQVLAILGTYFKIYYKVNGDLSVSQINTSKILKENFKKFMPYTYLYDIISEFWAGSGDRKLAEELQKPLEENRYVHLILESKWETLLYDWMQSQENKKSKKQEKTCTTQK